MAQPSAVTATTIAARCTCPESLRSMNELCPSCEREWAQWIADQEEAEANKHGIYAAHDIRFMAGERMAG